MVLSSDQVKSDIQSVTESSKTAVPANNAQPSTADAVSSDDEEEFEGSTDKVSGSRSPRTFDDVMETLRRSNVEQIRKQVWSGNKRYIFVAFLLWGIEIVLVLSLKKTGFLDHNFQLQAVVTERMMKLGLNESIIAQTYFLKQKERPGYKLHQRRIQQAQHDSSNLHPVVMVPGFVTSGLEVWRGRECARKHFRQRLWAALAGARSFLMETECWRQHMMLDYFTGMDPEGIQVRAAEGMEAADYFMANYWVWGKIIENLADVGYNPSLMAVEPYDWRLAFPLLEQRDGFFTKLKFKIELFHKTTSKKVVLTSHSMGALVVHYFFAWVTTSEKEGGGGGGKKWVDQHVHAYVNIAGSHLGVPKAATALLSGEMSDTVMTGTMGTMIEQFFGRRLRRDLWTTWGSLWAMLPRGGDALWGTGEDFCLNENRSDSDPLCPLDDASPLITMTDSPDGIVDGIEVDPSSSNKTLTSFMMLQKHYLKDTFDFLQEYGGGLGPQIANANSYSLYGHEKSSSRIWHDPTRTALPYAPNLKIYCLYGHGKDTERAYYYKRNVEDVVDDDGRLAYRTISNPAIILDSDMNNATQHVEYGVRYTDGDGSVPLLSLGYICADAWQRRETGLNPSRIKVYTREYKHTPEFSVEDPMRGGPRSSEHVDILGNVDVTEDFLRIVTDFEVSDVDQDHITSDIKSIAERINNSPNGGIQKRKKLWQL